MMASGNDLTSVIDGYFINGRLDTVNSKRFEDALGELFDQHNRIVVDFSQCSYMSSAGIRILIKANKNLRANDGELYLRSLTTEVFQVLEMAGLHRVFNIMEASEQVYFELVRKHDQRMNAIEWMADKHHFEYFTIEPPQYPALIWQNDGIAGLNELGFALGYGVPADSAESGKCVFATLGNCLAHIPENNKPAADFRMAQKTMQAGIFVDKAISFGTHVNGFVRSAGKDNLTLQQFENAVSVNRALIKFELQAPMAILLADFNAKKPSVIFALLLNDKSNKAINIFEDRILKTSTNSLNDCYGFLGVRIVLDELPLSTDHSSIDNFVHQVLSFENILSVEEIDVQQELTTPMAWVFAANMVEDAGEQRIQIEAPVEGFTEAYKFFLTRRLYQGCSRVELKQLHGGFSAQTFYVESYDTKGRLLRPTVMKIANRDMINHEAERCKQYALPYILNNSAMVLGTEFFNEYGALTYNFVGISGEQTELKWLAYYFKNWETGKLLSLFDSIFLQILKPWYGQPVKAEIFPFNDHNPTKTFFPNLCATAEDLFSISAETPSIYMEELGREIVNPYWYLNHEFKKHQKLVYHYNTSICHGDLNMQNILLDQDMNVYIIDFSETRTRSVITDFARLEAIFMIEHAILDSEEDRKSIIEFVERFYNIDQIDRIPENSYVGEHTRVMGRNIALTQKMREYSVKSAEGDSNIVPYYLALLEWVLPVVCFVCTTHHKRLSMVVAALICEKLNDIVGDK